MEKTILYIQKGNRSTIIHYINNEVEEKEILLEKYLNNICLEFLTTLSGRIEAIKEKYNIVKNVPIYIKDNLVLFPTFSKNHISNIYLNSIYIKKILPYEDKTIIVFYDNQELIIDKHNHTIKLSYEKCLKLINKININNER